MVSTVASQQFEGLNPGPLAEHQEGPGFDTRLVGPFCQCGFSGV